jgi:hypothetical protein
MRRIFKHSFNESSALKYRHNYLDAIGLWQENDKKKAFILLLIMKKKA